MRVTGESRWVSGRVLLHGEDCQRSSSMDSDDGDLVPA